MTRILLPRSDRAPRHAKPSLAGRDRSYPPVDELGDRGFQGDGQLGGFQGGLDMKRRLLAMEGVRFDVDGRVRGDYKL